MLPQETINALGVNAGTPLAFGVSLANDATIRKANATYIAAKQTAAQTQQATIQVAKDTLRSTGDVGPA